MNKKLVFLSALMLTACSANSLQHGAEGVRVTHNEPDTSCTYLGDVTGSQGNFFTGGWTSNSNLETGARNDLKNKASSIPVFGFLHRQSVLYFPTTFSG